MRSGCASLAGLARIVALTLALGCSACLGPKLVGSKIRSDDQEAMPYYLPRPYLLVTKNFNVTLTTKKTTTTTKPDGTQIEVVEEDVRGPSAETQKTDSGKTVYAYQIVYLPDQCNQYGLKISRGIGTLDTKIKLEDGWKFTGTELKTDSKTPETIEAVGKPISELGKALAGAIGSGARLGVATLSRGPGDELPGNIPEGADVALYDLFTGECQFAWPNRDACPEPPPCPDRE
jgi:hypothetical protein